MHYLRQLGYTVVRSAGSHGGADVWAGRRDAFRETTHRGDSVTLSPISRRILAIQCKRRNARPTIKEKRELSVTAAAFYAWPVIVWAKPKSRDWYWAFVNDDSLHSETPLTEEMLE